MEWYILLGAFMICMAFLGLLWKLPCATQSCGEEHHCVDSTSTNLGETVSACQQVLDSLETQKSQLSNRLEMLDEMIVKSDREIFRLQEQLSRMEELKTSPINETDMAMLNLLQAGGYDTVEIADFAGKEWEIRNLKR